MYSRWESRSWWIMRTDTFQSLYLFVDCRDELRKKTRSSVGRLSQICSRRGIRDLWGIVWKFPHSRNNESGTPTTCLNNQSLPRVLGSQCRKYFVYWGLKKRTWKPTKNIVERRSQDSCVPSKVWNLGICSVRIYCLPLSWTLIRLGHHETPTIVLEVRFAVLFREQPKYIYI